MIHQGSTSMYEIFNIKSIYLKTCYGKNLEFVKNPFKFGEQRSKIKINNIFFKYLLSKILKKKLSSY